MRYRILTFAIVLTASVIVGTAASAEVSDMEAGHWSGGAAIGFLGNTADRGADFALKGHLDYFLSRNFAVGPMLQYAGSGSQVIFGLTGMAKMYWAVPADERLRIVTQGGIGFARLGVEDRCANCFTGTDASFLLPVGVGVDYTVSKTTAVTADFLLNFTSLGHGDTHTNVMPGLYFGVRF